MHVATLAKRERVVKRAGLMWAGSDCYINFVLLY